MHSSKPVDDCYSSKWRFYLSKIYFSQPMCILSRHNNSVRNKWPLEISVKILFYCSHFFIL